MSERLQPTSESSRRREDRGLPPHIRTDPAMLDWRLSRVEEAVESLRESQATANVLGLPVARGESPGFPWLRAIGLLVLLVLGLKGHIAPETAAALAGKLLGIVWRPW